MPARHVIDDSNRLIVTTWDGDATDSELINAYQDYLSSIKNQSQYILYDEIVDLTCAGKLDLSVDGLRKLAEIAANADRDKVETRLALVVNSSLAFGLARMYVVYRRFTPNAQKQTRVFKLTDAALEWINEQE